MNEVKKFTISRKRWLRGEGGRPSKLLREADGKMCCLGIYLAACGVPKDKLAGQSTPYHLCGEIPEWLTDPEDQADGSILCDALMDINDDMPVPGITKLTEAQREKEISRLFRTVDVEVTFTD